MKKFWLMLLPLTTLSCSKPESGPEEVETYPLEITHKTGEGALLVGATVQNMRYTLFLTGNGKTMSGSIYGVPSNESPKSCRLSKNSIVYKFHVPAGEYTLEMKNESDGKKTWKTDVKIEDGKCVSINADGYAW